MPDAIPVIDLRPCFVGTAADKATLARQVGRAATEIGFLVVANHGLSQALLDRAFAVGREFFDLPLAEKCRLAPADPATPRGYTAFGTKNLARTLGQVRPPDLREQFYIGPLAPEPDRYRAYPGANRFYSANIWPARPADYRAVFSALYRDMAALAVSLMGLFALALELPERFFDDKIDRHFSTLPCNYYPEPPADVAPEQIRAGAHTDFGSLTILAIDGAPGGLEVDVPGAGWQAVVPPPRCLVVNIGDMMARWTNDRWRSTLHRVVNPPAQARHASARQSIGYFLHPNYDAEVACMPSCRDAGVAPKYPPILAGEHMRRKMERRVA